MEYDGTLCVRTIGYFQDYALLAGMRPVLDEAITTPILATCPRLLLEAAKKGRATPGKEDDVPAGALQNGGGGGGGRRGEVVVHIRLCNAPYHSYAYYDYSNYFQHVLPRALAAAAREDFQNSGGPNDSIGGGPAGNKQQQQQQQRKPRVTVVSSCDPRRGVVKDLVRQFNATVAPKRSAVADFCYLATARRLVVTESTFGWWAAYVAVPGAKEVHFPGDGAMPLPYDLDPEKVYFHDVRKGQFFGRANAASGKIKYELKAAGHVNATNPVKGKRPKSQRA